MRGEKPMNTQTAISPGATCFLAFRADPLAHPVKVGANGRAVRLSGILTSGRPGYVCGIATVKRRRVNLLVPASVLVSTAPARPLRSPAGLPYTV